MSQLPSAETINTLDIIAAILLRCFIITIVAVAFLWLLTFLMGDLIVRNNVFLLGLSRKEFDVLMLYFITLLKTLNAVFFLIPFLGIRLFLHGRRGNA